MTTQKHLFDLPDDIHFLNCAYMSPLMKAVQEAGIAGIRRKANPATVTSDDFFLPPEEVRSKFAKLVRAHASQIAIIPAASYGLKTAIDNVPANKGNHAITVSDEFPSGFYTLQNWCREQQQELKIISAPPTLNRRGPEWNNRLLEAINRDTSVVIISSVHWTDGTLFDLERIGQRCREVNAYFIVDGSQSAGALPIDVVKYNIDALVCAAYKWLMGPYSSGLAYFNEKYNEGVPIENSWMNRSNAHDFTRLTRYVEDHKPGAARFNAGEFSNLINTPMLNKALEQILEWGADNIQAYCDELSLPLIDFLQQKGYWIEEREHRAKHIFGFLLPPSLDRAVLLQELQQRKIFVSVRGDAIRVSPYLYNTTNDMDALIETLRSK